MGDARLGRDDTERVPWWGMDEREFRMGKAVTGTGGTTKCGDISQVGTRGFPFPQRHLLSTSFKEALIGWSFSRQQGGSGEGAPDESGINTTGNLSKYLEKNSEFSSRVQGGNHHRESPKCLSQTFSHTLPERTGRDLPFRDWHTAHTLRESSRLVRRPKETAGSTCV